MDGEKLGVLATVGGWKSGGGIDGSGGDAGAGIIFDTVKSSRKYPNLKNNPRVAWVIGCTSEITVQLEGNAEELEGRHWRSTRKSISRNSRTARQRESWPELTYFVVRPKWVRYCDYNPGKRTD